MRMFVPAVLLIVAFIHALPALGALGAAKLSALYGVPITEANLEILMRHRAVFFGLLAAFLGWAAFDPALHRLALVAGLVSVGSFLGIAARVGQLNLALLRVFKVDVVALVLLLVAGIVHLRAAR